MKTFIHARRAGVRSTITIGHSKFEVERISPRGDYETRGDDGLIKTRHAHRTSLTIETTGCPPRLLDFQEETIEPFDDKVLRCSGFQILQRKEACIWTVHASYDEQEIFTLRPMKFRDFLHMENRWKNLLRMNEVVGEAEAAFDGQRDFPILLHCLHFKLFGEDYFSAG